MSGLALGTNTEATTLALLDAARALDMSMTADKRVSAADAARLVGYSTATLRNMRAEGSGPRWYRMTAGNGSRVSYGLRDLADWIEEQGGGKCEVWGEAAGDRRG